MLGKYYKKCIRFSKYMGTSKVCVISFSPLCGSFPETKDPYVHIINVMFSGISTTLKSLDNMVEHVHLFYWLWK